MGAWGIGSFENDAAADWLFDYDSVGAEAVVQAFSEAAEQAGTGYLDVDIGSQVLAAAEVVAASFDRPSGAIDAQTLAQLREHAAEVKEIEGIQEVAVETVKLVALDPSRSELPSLWDESGELEAFSAAVEDLLRRLGAIE